MRESRLSIAGLMVVVAVVGAGLAPLASLSDAWLVALMYVEFGVVVAATFLARFGSAKGSGWWFGFATFGWGRLLISVPGLWYAVNKPVAVQGVDVADLTGSFGEYVAILMAESIPAGQLTRHITMVIAVVGFWFTMISAVAGGFLGRALDRRRLARSHPPE